jgi:hypothetical protein
MRNPWTTKNPFMSLWLSTAHTMLNAARGQAAAAAQRQLATLQADMTRQALDLWSGKAFTPAPAKKTTKKRRR